MKSKLFALVSGLCVFTWAEAAAFVPLQANGGAVLEDASVTVFAWMEQLAVGSLHGSYGLVGALCFAGAVWARLRNGRG